MNLIIVANLKNILNQSIKSKILVLDTMDVCGDLGSISLSLK